MEVNENACFHAIPIELLCPAVSPVPCRKCFSYTRMRGAFPSAPSSPDCSLGHFFKASSFHSISHCFGMGFQHPILPILYKLPILGKLFSFSGKSSLYKTGSARCSTTFRGMVPKTEANLLMHSDLGKDGVLLISGTSMRVI